jgi:hypothetical protein
MLRHLLSELPSNAVALQRREAGKSAAREDAIAPGAAVAAAAWGHQALERARSRMAAPGYEPPERRTIG